MEAPCNLLSCYAIEKLWPAHYTALREITSVPAVNKTTEVSAMVSNTEVEATKVQEDIMVPVPAKRTIFPGQTAEKKYIIPAKRTPVPSHAKEKATEVSV